jgi:hypothetical protein
MLEATTHALLGKVRNVIGLNFIQLSAIGRQKKLEANLFCINFLIELC